MIIKTPRLEIRNFKRDDYEDYLEIFLKARLSNELGDSVRINKDMIGFNFENRLNNSSAFAIVERRSGRVIGTIEFKNVKAPAGKRYLEIGYALNKTYSKNGFMSEAVKCLLKYSFENSSLDAVVAQVMPQNTDSLNLLYNCGFKELSAMAVNASKKNAMFLILSKKSFEKNSDYAEVTYIVKDEKIK